MKIIEAIHRLSTIERYMKENHEKIKKYSSNITSQTPQFETPEKQKQMVSYYASLNEKLFEEYLQLKDDLNITNILTCITVDGETRSINQFLNMQRRIGKLLQQTYEKMNDDYAHELKKNSPSENVNIVRYFNEEDRNNRIHQLTSIFDKISSSLDIANATIDVIESSTMTKKGVSKNE